jgi:hypothetical protein
VRITPGRFAWLFWRGAGEGVEWLPALLGWHLGDHVAVSVRHLRHRREYSTRIRVSGSWDSLQAGVKVRPLRPGTCAAAAPPSHRAQVASVSSVLSAAMSSKVIVIRCQHSAQ